MKLPQSAVKLFQGLLLLAGFILIVWMIWADRVGLNAVGYCEQKHWGDSKRIKDCEDEQAEAFKNRSPEEKARSERVRDLVK